jgi:hypothetical protein
MPSLSPAGLRVPHKNIGKVDFRSPLGRGLGEGSPIKNGHGQLPLPFGERAGVRDPYKKMGTVSSLSPLVRGLG